MTNNTFYIVRLFRFPTFEFLLFSVQFVVHVSQTDLTLFTGTMDVELINSDGTVMMTWLARHGHSARLNYKLASNTREGWWTVTARVGEEVGIRQSQTPFCC